MPPTNNYSLPDPLTSNGKEIGRSILGYAIIILAFILACGILSFLIT